MRAIKGVVAWLVIAGLVVFALTNFHIVQVDLAIAALEAPLSYIIALAALAGAFAGEALVTAIRLGVRPRRR